MNIALWIVQVLLGVAFLAAGIMKATKPRAELQPKMPWVEDFSDNQLKAIGIIELLAGLGMILPWATGIAPILTPIAAAGLVVVMILAAVVHVRRKEFSGVPVNVVLGALALFVALGRF